MEWVGMMRGGGGLGVVGLGIVLYNGEEGGGLRRVGYGYVYENGKGDY
jgi:hypothetical protein